MISHGLRVTRVIAIAFAAVVASSLLASFVALGHHQPSSSDLCGATITEDLKLDHDLVCTGQGITLGADDIEIELKGHTISGPGNVFGISVGIRVDGRSDVEITGPGTVRGFFTGVAIVGSNDVSVEKIDIVGNGRIGGEGVRVASSSDVEIEKSRISGNRGEGIEIRASTGVEVEKNDIRGNTVGISLLTGATGNTFEKNEIRENTVGISLSIGVTGNTFVKNGIVANNCGVRGPASDNTFVKNRFEGNVANLCGGPGTIRIRL